MSDPFVENERADDQARLERNGRSRATSARLRERSQITLLAADQTANYQIAKQLGLDVNTVGRWRNCYASKGYPGIEKDRPRGGNHGGINTADQARIRSLIIDTTIPTNPHGATHWPVRNLARYLGVTHSLVGRVWQKVEPKPHLEKHTEVSNDPNFEDKLHDAVRLYMDPPDNAVVFCVDEKSSIQALDQTQSSLSLKRGRCGTTSHDYKRYGTRTLFAALEVATAEVIGQCKPRHRHREFLGFLKTVEQQTPAELDLLLIVDNYATHKHEKVKNWLKRNPRVTLHFIPASSFWLNLIEPFFGLITDKQIRRGVFTSVQVLEEAIHEFVEHHNAHKKPFVWTQSATEILRKVTRARKTPKCQEFVRGTTLEVFDDDSDAVAMANATRFGLRSSVWSARPALRNSMVERPQSAVSRGGGQRLSRERISAAFKVSKYQ